MWYYKTNGQRSALITLNELKRLTQSGIITSNTEVGEDNYPGKPACLVPELESSLKSQGNITSSADASYNELKKKLHQGAGAFVSSVQDSTGVGRMEGFSLKGFFSQVFRKHTEEEMEAYFGVGCPRTTPGLLEIDPSWPTPWFFLKILFFGLVAFFGLWKCYQSFHNFNLLPAIVFFGSFAVPISFVMFFFEINKPRNVSAYQTLGLFFCGGVFGLIFALQGFDFGSYIPGMEYLGASAAGLIEEPAKIAVLIFLLLKGKLQNRNFMLNGLLFGAAVGAGFAAFESAGYAFNMSFDEVQKFALDKQCVIASAEDYNAAIDYGVLNMYDIIVIRGLLSPFGHIIWTAMIAAALWRVKGDKEFDFSMLLSPSFLIVFAIAVSLHMAWNSSNSWLVQFGYLRYLALGAIGWLVIFGQIGIGLRQIRNIQQSSQG